MRYEELKAVYQEEQRNEDVFSVGRASGGVFCLLPLPSALLYPHTLHCLLAPHTPAGPLVGHTQNLPFHYIEISSAILNVAMDDVEDAHRVRTFLEVTPFSMAA